MDSDDWNRVRFRPGSRVEHVESFFFKLNDPAGRRALWLKATILARPGKAPVAEAWAIAFDREAEHIAAKQVVPYESATFSRDRFDVHVADVELTTGRIAGKVSARGHTIDWELQFDPAGSPLVPFPSLRMYETKLPSSKLVSPHPDTRFSGRYRVDGTSIEVDGWRGMQGHNWGRRHAEHYGWGHCNQWTGGPDVMLEGVTARVKLGPIVAPPLTLVCVWVDGERHHFNSVRQLVTARGSIETRAWSFRAASETARVEGELSADTRDFVGLYYENPDGDMTYCLNSKIARGRLRIELPGKPALELRTDSAALEIGTKDPNHGVRMLA
jgi:hypothetical protein